MKTKPLFQCGKMALLKTIYYKLYNDLSLFSHYKHIDWPACERFVFVCKGNICRSAYAKFYVKKMGLPTASFGLDAAPRNMHPLARQVAKERGLEVTSHTASNIKNYQAQPGDVLIAFEPLHMKRLKSLSNLTDEKITLLGLWTQPPQPYIHDPYNSTLEYHRQCYELIENSIDSIIHLKNKSH